MESVSLVRKICTSLSIIMYIVVVFLNFYWFMLILKGLKKLLQEQGILKKGANEKDDERLNFGLDDGKSAKIEQTKEALKDHSE